MIIVDYSQTIISNLMAELNGRKDIELEIPLLRHMVLNTLRSYNNRFKEDYGNMVIACDSKEKYWRKEYFQYYKSNQSCSFLEDTGFCLSPLTIESSGENTLGIPSPLSPLIMCSKTRCSGGLSALTNLFFKDEYCLIFLYFCN